MQIIKPQQLVYLKNAYQLGQTCYAGISVVCGCYLNKTNHFITEPQIWDAWEKSPKSVDFLDIPVVKQFAEYVLVGHADIGKEVLSLDAEVTVGSLKKQWRVVGAGNYLKRKKFRAVAMDHPNVWGGKTDKNNPLGKGQVISVNDTPNVIWRRHDRLAEKNSLAAPSPLPFNFYERKQYLDRVAPIMAAPKYLATDYPGYPPEFDLRYWQISAPDQWLSGASWPAGAGFSLRGFGGTEETLSGTFPKIKARAFGFNNRQLVTEIALLQQTIWFLPDFNLAFLVYTGEIVIEELTADPFNALMLALDSEDTPRSLDYYRHIFNKRVLRKSKLATLLDPDLMPAAAAVNVIHSAANHPAARQYQARPMPEHEAHTYFEQVRQSILAEDKAAADLAAAVPLSSAAADLMLPAVKFTDRFTAAESEYHDKCYQEFAAPEKVITGKIFRRCHFKHIDFNAYQFIDCVFDCCNFYHCSFLGGVWRTSSLSGGQFYACRLNRLEFSDLKLSSVKFLECELEKCRGSKLEFTDSLWEKCRWQHINFSQSRLQALIFTQTTIENFSLTTGLLAFCLWQETKLSGIKFTQVNLEANSGTQIIWQDSIFADSFVMSLSIGDRSRLQRVVFQDCWLEKMGLGNIHVTESKFDYCNIKEINGSFSDFRLTKFNHCDIMSAVFKDSNLQGTQWQECGLQQNIFYNADFSYALLTECNLVGANLALIVKNKDTIFKRCLLNQVLWQPQRPLTAEG